MIEHTGEINQYNNVKATMNFLSKCVIFSLSTCSAFFSSPAMAQFTTNATLNYDFRLLDLDPNDGVTPAINFFNTTTMSLSGFTSITGQADYNIVQRTDFDPISTSIVQGDANGSASSLGKVLQSNVQIVSPGYVYAIERIESNFTLTPNTQVIFFGNASGSAAGPTGTLDQYVYSYSYLALSDQTPTDPATRFDRYWEGADSLDGHAPASFNSAFEVSYSNNGATSLNGYAHIYTQATSTYVPPVPEPATYATMLLGLGMLGFIARRRKQA